MVLWMSSEADKDVGRSYRSARNKIEKAVNKWLETANYGTTVKEWVLIGIVTAEEYPGFGEVNRFTKKSGVAEFRLRIDHAAFKKAANDMNARCKLICKSLIRSLDLLAKKKIPDFDHKSLMADFREFAKKKGWL